MGFNLNFGGVPVEWMGDTTEIMLDELAMPKIRQKDVAVTYALARMCSNQPVDWKRVNQAIIAKWSLSGLQRIKNAAGRIMSLRDADAQQREKAQEASHDHK
jgi:hypothetical protein